MHFKPSTKLELKYFHRFQINFTWHPVFLSRSDSPNNVPRKPFRSWHEKFALYWRPKNIKKKLKSDLFEVCICCLPQSRVAHGETFWDVSSFTFWFTVVELYWCKIMFECGVVEIWAKAMVTERSATSGRLWFTAISHAEVLMAIVLVRSFISACVDARDGFCCDFWIDWSSVGIEPGTWISWEILRKFYEILAKKLPAGSQASILSINWWPNCAPASKHNREPKLNPYKNNRS